MKTTLRDFYRAQRGNFDAFLFDVDGTLSLAGRPLPGAQETLDLLKREKFPYLILTNDSSMSCEEKAFHQRRHGLQVAPEEILSAGNALENWAAKFYRGELFFQCGSLGEPDYAANARINVTFDLDRLDECSGVLLGEGNYEWHSAIEGLFNYFLHHADAPLIVPNPDGFWPWKNFCGIGSGGIARFLELLLKEAGKKLQLLYLGKPYAPIYEAVPDRLKQLYPGRSFQMKRIAGIGDHLLSDICGANCNGLVSVLLLTGLTSEKQAREAQGESAPRFVLDSL
ncbi:MAG: HAD hydrolase-like protein [Victivallaceae bacterium]|nr:HAD hydrolase-like protein [Victivallaceae bacterium]